MPRFALQVEYDGAPFAGWQAQADQPSVQGAIETAAAAMSGEAVASRGEVVGCGDQVHEKGWSVYESKRHHPKLIGPISRQEGSL